MARSPRPDRMEKHRAVAQWIESLGRPDDHAEMLAYHWRSSLELARATSREAPDLVDATRLALRNAGDRAVALNAFGPAEAYYGEALEIWPEDAPDRADLMFRRARALFVSADDRREQALKEARDLSIAAGDKEAAAEAEAYLSRAAWFTGRRDAAFAHLDRAGDLLEGAGPSAAKARVLSSSARLRFLAGDLDDALRIASEALALAEELQLDEIRAHALTTMGSTKSRLALSTGREELERALEIASAANSPQLSNILNNLGVFASEGGDVERADEHYREALRAAERMGDRDNIRFMRGNRMFLSLFRGRWDELSEDADRFVAECEVSPHYLEGPVRRIRAYIRLARGDHAGAVADLDQALTSARDIKDPEVLIPSLLQCARGYVLLGRNEEAREFAAQALDLTRDHPDLAEYLGQVNDVAKQLGIREDIRKLLEQAPANAWKEAALAGAQGDFVRSGDVYAKWSLPTFEAEARFAAAEELIAAGRRKEGEEQLERAMAFYRSVGATFFIQRGEGLVAQAATG